MRPHLATPPDRIGDYRVLGLLGRGGSALVYAAESVLDGSRAALKIPDPSSAIGSLWFRREASLVARLSHRNVVRLLSSGTLADGQPFLAFEHIGGPSLESIADRLDTESVVVAMAQVLDALGYAHDAGVVHCDVKPENVLVAGWDGDRPIVKLTDFGLAATRAPADGSADETLPVIAGTPGYLSPEQARGVGMLSPAADIYGAGATLYRLLSGAAPHAGADGTDVIERTLRTDAPRLVPAARHDLDPSFVELVHRLLAREPGRRPASAHRAREALLAAGARSRSGRPAAARSIAADAPTIVEPVVVQEESRGPVTMRKTPRALRPLDTVARTVDLIGRDAELAMLVEALGLRRAETVLVTLVGQRGSGRTRLAEAVSAELASLSIPTYRVTGRRGTDHPPFETLGALAFELLDAPEAAGGPWRRAEHLADALEAAGASLGDPGRDAIVGGVAGVALPTASLAVRLSAFRAFQKLLAAHVGPRGRALLVVDDADAMDGESRAVLEQLARGDARPELDVRVLLVCESSALPDDPTVGHLDVPLPPLGADHAVRLLKELAGVEDARAVALAIRAGGLPSVLVELVSGTSRKIDAPWPRLHGLGDATRAVLEAAATFDGDVPLRAIVPMSSVGGVDPESAEEALDLLLIDRLLVGVKRPVARAERTVRFACDAFAEGVRASIPTDRRRELHAAASDWLGFDCMDGSHGTTALRAEHAERAGDIAVAAWALAEAGRWGSALGHRRAPEHLGRALTLARSSKDAAEAVDEPMLLTELARIAAARGEPETAELLAKDALVRVERDRTTLAARLHRIAGQSLVDRRLLARAIVELDEALRVAGPDGDAMERASSLATKGWVRGYLEGHTEEGLALMIEASEIAAGIDDPAFRATLCGRLGASYLRAGDWNGQLATNLMDLGLSTRARDVGGTIRAHINLGVCYTNRGHVALARAHTEEARRLAKRYGRLASFQLATNNLAMIAADDLRFDDAEALAAEVVEISERGSFRAALSETWATIARTHMARGRIPETRVAIRRARESADGAYDRELADRLEGSLLVREGQAHRAVELLTEVAARSEYDPYERASTQITLAHALRAVGRATDATALDIEADATYARLGADPAHERRRWCPE